MKGASRGKRFQKSSGTTTLWVVWLAELIAVMGMSNVGILPLFLITADFLAALGGALLSRQDSKSLRASTGKG
ncbi:MAG: hypothetical protein HY320_08135 [Armatimonadetes bacterium]|nr:hypothetical protein [Armatimonadota bacterium]